MKSHKNIDNKKTNWNCIKEKIPLIIGEEANIEGYASRDKHKEQAKLYDEKNIPCYYDKTIWIKHLNAKKKTILYAFYYIITKNN